jgi:hypothetical protein
VAAVVQKNDYESAHPNFPAKAEGIFIELQTIFDRSD